MRARIDTDAEPWGGCSLRLLAALGALAALLLGTRVTRRRRQR